MLNVLRRRAERRRNVETLLARLLVQARLPIFYGKFQVADSIDGRFDLLVLHAWLVLDRLSIGKEPGFAQAFVDGLFVQFDEALREQGAGDIGMSRRINKMANAFYGRMNAYRDAADVPQLEAAILRNVFRDDATKLDHARALAIYAASARTHLVLADLTLGIADFGPLP